jgi:hypothetical protein
LYSYSALHVLGTLAPIIRSLLILHIQPPVTVSLGWLYLPALVCHYCRFWFSQSTKGSVIHWITKTPHYSLMFPLSLQKICKIWCTDTLIPAKRCRKGGLQLRIPQSLESWGNMAGCCLSFSLLYTIQTNDSQYK